ncbi:MAG: thioredoxin family protein [Planctomycetes bacterium]|nr:thioredoxin family protein [Planctomycetota bacterium]
MSRLTRRVMSCALTLLLVGAAGLPMAAAQDEATPAPAAEKTDTAIAPAEEAKPAAEGHKEDGWLTSLEEAKKQAAAQGKPIFIDFTATWCPPCKMLDAQTFPDEGVKTLLAKFVTLRVDVDQDQATSQAYNISSMPTLVVVDADGKPLVRHSGFIPPEPMREFLGDVLKFSESLAAYRKDATSTEALLVLADLCPRMELSKDEKLGYIDAAIKLAKEDDKAQRAKLKLSRGVVLAVAGDAREEADHALQEAAKLDADNAAGVREQVDWYLGLIAAGKDKDVAKLAKTVEKYIADYPLEKIKNPDLRLQALLMLFQVSRDQGQYETTVKVLETLKAEFAEKLGADKIDQALAAMKAELQKEQEPAEGTSTETPAGAATQPEEKPADTTTKPEEKPAEDGGAMPDAGE